MADTTPIKCETFSDIYRIVEARASISGTVQDRDRNLIKGFINQWYETIATERNWWWRKRDRSFIFKPARATGTVSVTEDSRIATFTGLTLTLNDIGESLRVTGDEELYRIIGVDTVNNRAFLETTYTGATNASATFKLYKYEFALPPNLDNINQLFTYGRLNNHGQLIAKNVLEFNRMLSLSSDYGSIPAYYCRDGVHQNPNTDFAVLDEMILDFDFLGGSLTSDAYQIPKVRIFPIEPDKKRPIQLNYTAHIDHLLDDDSQPLIPRDDRWVLVHYALGEWNSFKGMEQAANREFSKGRGILKNMREEHKKSDVKPKLIYDKSKNTRKHDLGGSRDEFYASRALET